MISELEAAAADWFRGLVKKHSRPAAAKIGAACANCGAVLQGAYCHVCGQNSDDHKRSILHLFWEAIEGLLHLDGRLWRTLPALFFRPGRLARDYIEGRTARHVPPFRTFLVSLLLLIFAAEHAIHVLREHEEVRVHAETARLATPQGREAEAARLRSEAVKERDEELKAAADERVRDLKSADSDGERRQAESDYQSSLRTAQTGYAKQTARADGVQRGEIANTSGVLVASPERRRDLAAQIRNNVTVSATPAAGGGHVTTKVTDSWFKEGLAKAVENPDYYLTVMFGWAHRIAVLLLPIVGLSLALVYLNRRKYFLYDHLLVAMNLLSFAFLTNALGLILPQTLWPYWFGLLALWTPVNLFQTLRGAYGSSVVGALTKTLVVWFITVIAFSALLTGLLLLTLSQV